MMQAMGQLAENTNPINQKAWDQTSKPKFNGDPGVAWHRFTREWETAIREVDPTGKQLKDARKLQMFRECMDKGTQSVIQDYLETHPKVSFEEVFSVVDSMMGGDVKQMVRLDWENVQLRVKGDRLTLKDWLKFSSDFVLAMNRVKGRSLQEEHQLIMTQIPNVYRKRILRDQQRMQDSMPWVTVANFPESDKFEVAEFFRHQRVRIGEIHPDGQSFEIQCSSWDDRKKCCLSTEKLSMAKCWILSHVIGLWMPKTLLTR